MLNSPSGENLEGGLSGWFQHLLGRLRYLMTQFSLGRWEELSRLELLLVYPPILIVQVFRELIRDRGLVRASSLAFTTALSVVPLLTVATVLLSAFGMGEGRVLIGLLENLLPVSGDTIATHLSDFSQHQGGTLTGIGSVVLILLGVVLFNNIEYAFNDVWRIRGRRPLVSKFLTFYALITLAPLMIAISVVESARVQFLMNELPFFATVGYKLLPLGLAVVAFTLANKLLPYTEVRWVPALVSGLITAIAFELAKTGFNFYATHFVMESYTNVYGAISVIPIFLVWVYLTWVIVLFGAELTYTIQNLRFLLLPQRLHDINKNEQEHFNPLVGLQVFSPIATAFKCSHGPIELTRIAATAGVPLSLANEVIETFVRERLVLPVEMDNSEREAKGYIVARPLSDIPILEVVRCCRPDVKSDELNPFIGSLGVLFRSRESDLFEGMDCSALVNEDDKSRVQVFASTLAAGVTDAQSNQTDKEILEAASALVSTRPGNTESLSRGKRRLQTAAGPIDALGHLGDPEAKKH